MEKTHDHMNTSWWSVRADDDDDDDHDDGDGDSDDDEVVVVRAPQIVESNPFGRTRI